MPYPLLTPADVAALCQVSPKTVMRAIQSQDPYPAKPTPGFEPGTPSLRDRTWRSGLAC